MAANNFAGCHDAKKRTNTCRSDDIQERLFNYWYRRDVVFMGVVSSCKSSHPEVICKKGIPKKFTKFTSKYQSWLESLFSKIQGLKKRPQHRCFPVNFTIFSKHLFCETSAIGCFWSCNR